MKSNIWQDDKVWTHIDWELDDVTAVHVNWFWSNMEKGYYLWHPGQHKGFEWFVSIKELATPIGSIHIATQTRSDGKKICPYIRMEALQDVPDEIKELVKYDHVVIVGRISMTGENVKPDDPSLAYRVHQWQKSDNGLVGMSSAVDINENDAKKGMIWAEHACEEIGNWEVFLPDLYRLYKVVTNRDICPNYSFRVEGQGKSIKYQEI